MARELFDKPIHELPLNDPRRKAVARGYKEFRKFGELLRRQLENKKHGTTQTQDRAAA